MKNTTLLTLLSVAGSWDEFAGALKDLWSIVWKFVLSIGATALVAYGIFIAVSLTMAGGDEAKKKQAKAKILYFGLGIVFAFIIVVGVPMVLGGLYDWAGSYV